VSFDAISSCFASERLFIVVSIYFVIDSVRKLLDTTSYYLAHFQEVTNIPLWTHSRKSLMTSEKWLRRGG